MTNTKNKTIYIEVLRTVSIFLVIFNHTRGLGNNLYSYVLPDTFSYWGSLALSIFCKVAVPIFFMISGGMLLGKEESIRELFQKRIFR